MYLLSNECGQISIDVGQLCTNTSQHLLQVIGRAGQEVLHYIRDGRHVGVKVQTPQLPVVRELLSSI